VIFTSDNGGMSQYMPPLKGGKSEVYEGGIRVPLVVAGHRSSADSPLASPREVA
jgi:arylsulfatase A-like enzyme